MRPRFLYFRSCRASFETNVPFLRCLTRSFSCASSLSVRCIVTRLTLKLAASLSSGSSCVPNGMVPLRMSLRIVSAIWLYTDFLTSGGAQYLFKISIFKRPRYLNYMYSYASLQYIILYIK